MILVEEFDCSIFARHLKESCMKKLPKLIFILIFTFTVQNSVLVSASTEHHVSEPINSVYAKEYLWNKNYHETLEFIKSHEGFSSLPYQCVAGQPTIGYGHLIKENEQFSAPISERKALELLKKDFDTALKLTESLVDIEGSRKLAIAHFVYSVGIGNFSRSQLKKLIDQNKPIDEAILLWSNYTSSGGTKIRSEMAFKIRQWELYMYNKDESYFHLALK
jgi:lysozyme